MARPARPWFRFYVEAFPDRKIRRLTPTQRWIWVSILGAARESPDPGHLLIAEGLAMTPDELAEYAGVKPRDIPPALAAMRALGMVTDSPTGLIQVTNFTRRQFESDDVTARTKAHRERSKELGRNVPKNVRGNAPETETETETEEKRSVAGFSRGRS